MTTSCRPSALLTLLAGLIVLLGAPATRGGEDCPGSPCESCATATPTFQPSGGDIVVYYNPAVVDPARAQIVAETASGASSLTFPPWQLGPACTLPAHCGPRYRIVIKSIDATGQVPVSDPHLMFIDDDFVATGTPLEITAVVLHEWVHWVQLCYYDIREYEAWGEWIIEGTAASMEDKIDLEIDRDPDSFYVTDWANAFLGLPGEPLYYQDYRAALWWTYMSEQLGLEFDEPALGVNVIRHFLEYALPQNPPDNMKYLRNTVAHFDSSRTLETLFRDFCIANYTKQLDLDDLPEEVRDRFRYVDESPAGGGTVLQDVSIKGSNTNFGVGVAHDFEVSSWSATYLEQELSGVHPCSAVGMRGVAEKGKELYWVLVGIASGDGPDRVTRLSWRRGRTFNRSFLSPRGDSFTRLGVIAISVNGPVEAELTVDAGLVEPSILAPSEASQLCIPSGARFGVEVQVAGPAGLVPPGSDPAKASVGGLVKSDFGVALVSAATNAVFPANVGWAYQIASGSYGLTCRASAIDTSVHGDTFHLRVCLCPDADGDCAGPAATNQNAIVLGDFVNHQMLVLDVSGSMEYDNKLESAKTMARFLVNSAPDDSSLGFVVFSGNGTEMPTSQGACDDDATLVRGLSPMTSLNQLQLAGEVDSDDVTANGYTSIGDGLLLALDELLAAQEPADKKRIMLLSDGMENEAAFWGSFYNRCGYDPVRLSFDPENANAPGAGVRIDARGFGHDADIESLKKLTGLTDGVVESVPTDEPTLGAGAGAGGGSVTLLPDPLELTVANRLAESFRSLQEDALGLERLFFAAALVESSPTTVTIPVGETLGGVRRAAFGFNWTAGSAVTITLRDRNGSVITDQTSGWRVVRPPSSSPQTNVVYHHAGLLQAGDYSATISASATTQVLCLLSGELVQGVETDLRVELTEENSGFCIHNAGAPVRLTLTAVDNQGGITGLDLVAIVRNPDGSTNRRTLFDDGEHFDGEANDGVYGNTYPRTPFAQPVIPNRREHDDPVIQQNFGTYSVRVTVQGTSHLDEPFTRYESSLFTVTERISVKCALDDDQDGLLDPWETQVGLDPSNPADALVDQDNDGLLNADEFLHGTDPFNPDSDFGGESDGSEVAAGRDPIWERDDALPPIQDFGFVRGVTDVRDDGPQPPPGVIRLRFPASTEYEVMHIYRTTTPNPDWDDFTEIARVDVDVRPRGLYDDTEVSPHIKHYYYLQAEGLSGALTPPTDIVSWVTSPLELADPGGTLNIGITAQIVDDDGTLWQLDEGYLAAAANLRIIRSRESIETDLLTRPVPEEVLAYARFGDTRYQIPVVSGPYTVTLYFAEICPRCVSRTLGGTGCGTCRREFTVAVEDQETLHDPADAALPPAGDGRGAVLRATELIFEVDVRDGVLDIAILTAETRPPGLPLVQALSIERGMEQPRLTILRGDSNDDGRIDISDAVRVLVWLFRGGRPPPCAIALDVSGDGSIDISDATSILAYLLQGGPAPVAPFPLCGPLPEDEAGRCEEQPRACGGRTP